MTAKFRLATAQLNPTVGAVSQNVALHRDARRKAADDGAALVVGSELAISGYPPEDLVLKGAFVSAVRDGVEQLAAETDDGGPAMLVGAPWRDGDKLYNAALLLDGGKVAAVRCKQELPNYGVFDEKRVFAPGPPAGPVSFRGLRLGVCVCEDIWVPDVCETLEESGAEIIIVPNGSPFEENKDEIRMNKAVARVTETGLPLVYVNQVGGQDELVFDGGSFILNGDCSLALHAPYFAEDLQTSEWRQEGERWVCAPGAIAPPPGRLAAIYQAMVLGLRDYVGKNGFSGVVLGLSGGIDSALTAVVAADALGADRVHTIMLPSPYTSRESLEDAAELARRVGLRLDEVSIEPAMGAFDDMLRRTLNAPPSGVTAENIQSRARGLTLMAISNASGAMLLTTGNKSEMSVGYATIYGDMCGGFSVLKDIYKTDVFALSRWRNGHVPAAVQGMGAGPTPIPDRTIAKPPSAELRPGQTDQDTLPPYDELDRILRGLVEEDLDAATLARRGCDRATVDRVWRLLELAEYKRRQAPPGVKITRRAFGRDRRYPITNGFRGA